MAISTGELIEYLKIIDGIRKRIIASHEALLVIQKEIEDGKREQGTALEQVEIDSLKELRGALILHLAQIEKLIGQEK